MKKHAFHIAFVLGALAVVWVAAAVAGCAAVAAYALPLKLNIPCCPTVIAQPRPGLTGQWETLMVEHGLNASFISERGQLSGFVLMGEETAEAPFLQDEIPNWMNL